MTPFQEFRLWARRAPVNERVGAGVAAVLVLALFAWLLVPGGDNIDSRVDALGPGFVPDRDVVAVDGAPGVSSRSPSEGGVVGSPTVVSDSTTPDPGDDTGEVTPSGPRAGAGPTDQQDPAPASGAECTPPGEGVRGVTESTIKVAGVITEIAGPAANDLFGIPSADEQEANLELVVGAINAEGGMACRQVDLILFRANPADQTGLQQRCLDIVEAGAFVVVDTGAYARFPQKQCFAQNGIPYFGGYFLNADEQQKYHPYLFALYLYDSLHRNTVIGLRDLGFFDGAQGFEKLGFIYQSCVPSMVDNMRRALADAGAAGDEIVTYDVGCPSAFASPAELSQAVLTFQRSGVTHVTFASFVGDFPNFTRIAQQQRFRPKYGIPDESVIATSYGGQRPDADNISGAIAITAGRSGEERTPGVTPTEATRRCSAIYEAAGRPSVYDQPTLAGNVCSQLWMLRAAIDNAPVLRGDALAEGLRRAGTVEFSFPAGPNDFTADRVTTGGQFWRPTTFHLDCRCWKLAAPEFRSGR